jgi:thiamine biosynthesis lipoprotein
MNPVTVARHAMATRFEVVLYGENATHLRAAGEEALEEIERLDAQLSLYRPGSELSQINARAARQPVRVEPGLFRLLARAQLLHRETMGAFDITIAPLLRCWGFMGGGGSLPDPQALATARAQVGMQWVELNEAEFTIQFHRPGMMLDLGSIGKGYAIEKAAELLEEAGVASGLIHGGTSSVYAIGNPPDAAAWKVALDRPGTHPGEKPSGGLIPQGRQHPGSDFLAVIPLKDESLSVSAVWGKSFAHNGRLYGHVLDPRLGEPVQGAHLAAAILPSATETDAWTTALLALGRDGLGPISQLRPAMRTLLLGQDPGSGSWWVESRAWPEKINLQASPSAA